jgi:hypothetical protein
MTDYGTEKRGHSRCRPYAGRNFAGQTIGLGSPAIFLISESYEQGTTFCCEKENGAAASRIDADHGALVA